MPEKLIPVVAVALADAWFVEFEKVKKAGDWRRFIDTPSSTWLKRQLRGYLAALDSPEPMPKWKRSALERLEGWKEFAETELAKREQSNT